MQLDEGEKKTVSFEGQGERGLIPKEIFVGFGTFDNEPKLYISRKRRPEDDDDLVTAPIDESRQPNGKMERKSSIDCEGITDCLCSVTVDYLLTSTPGM